VTWRAMAQAFAINDVPALGAAQNIAPEFMSAPGFVRWRNRFPISGSTGLGPIRTRQYRTKTANAWLEADGRRHSG
jgi:hypothetical protein